MKGRSAVAGIIVAALVMGVHVRAGHAVIPDTDLAFLTESRTARSRADGPAASFVRPLLWTILFGGVLFGGLAVAYRRRRLEENSELIRVLASSPVSQGVVVQIVDVAGILYVMTLSRTGQTLLGEIREREKISEIRSRLAGDKLIPIPPIPFKAALEKFFRRPKPSAEPDPAAPAGETRRSAREALLRETLERVRRMDPSQGDSNK